MHASSGSSSLLQQLYASSSTVLGTAEDLIVLDVHSLNFRHRVSSIQDRRFATLQRTLFIYLINKYISLSHICLTVHH